MVLVHLCESCNLDYAIAHCNFQLRAAESDSDEVFVAGLSKAYGRPFYVTRFDTLGYMNRHGGSIQMAARELRYHWFDEIMKAHSLQVLCTAHHADDVLETFLINLSRGTGLDGLTGIREQAPGLVRPLLPFYRNELLAYAEENRYEWREDSSNEEDTYLRNKIRRHLVPLLKELHPTFNENFQKTTAHLSGSARILQDYKNQLRAGWLAGGEGLLRIPVKPLLDLVPKAAYMHLLFSEYGFREGEELGALLTADSGKLLYSPTHRLIKDRDLLLLERLKEDQPAHFRFPAGEGRPETPVRLKIETVECLGELEKNILYVDKETLNKELTLRKWQKGDYFYPLGMKGKKKVSKYFKDEKMDLIAKEEQWLLCSGDDIVWILGRRADERFKVKATTKEILKITWEA